MSAEVAPVDKYAHRFDIGNEVWVLHGNQPHTEFYSCPGCGGEGGFHIETVRHHRVTCPDCHGRGKVWLDSEVRFYTLAERTIGQVTVKVTVAHPATPHDLARWTQVSEGEWRTVEYMAHETGIGSGNNYHEVMCFPTKGAAVAYAEAQGWVTEAVAKSPKGRDDSARRAADDDAAERQAERDTERLATERER